jgi:DNA-binding GntR family transcriptional regulator
MAEIRTLDPALKSLTDQAHDAVRREILTARLRPGDAVSEAALAARFGFGKAPIRAALVRLAQEGLVRAQPRRGYAVTPVTLRDVGEVFELRLVLEPAAARLAAGKADIAELRRLDAVCEAGYRPGDAESALAFLDANRAFHVSVASLSGNRRLAEQVGRLLDEMTRMLLLGLAGRDRTGEMAHEHRALIEALAAKDGARAEKIVREQIEAARRMVLGALVKGRSELEVA